ncbi:hypothetical protein L1987_80474 [Smallanthus sonchifolius]|uniref:Uncharacterized protein n=1 Tax=Smallanthus sonchifolius TaxID=185202 RepID=A0ACB8YND1_9ASTR|nr:hypothetical protein L1987_80474 [Smallanthus sonchifolius]
MDSAPTSLRRTPNGPDLVSCDTRSFQSTTFKERTERVSLKSYSAYVYRGTRVGGIPNIVTYSRNTVYRNIIR